MEKRLFLAIGLSLLVLMIWSHFLPRAQQPVSLPAPQPAPKIIADAVPEPETPASSLFQYPGEKLEITFAEPQAAITEVVFRDYQQYKFPLKYACFLGDKKLNFKLEAITPQGPIFIFRDQTKQITKRFLISNSNYTIELQIQITNLSNQPLNFILPLLLGGVDFGRDPSQDRFRDVAVALPDKVLHVAGRKDIQWENAKFIGLRDRYFCGILEPVSQDYQGFLKKTGTQGLEIGLISSEIQIPAGGQAERKFRIYLGPQELQIINALNPEWAAIMHYGTFDLISRLLLKTLEFFYRLVHNWGVAIILLGILIYFVLFPLTLKQMRSMKQMQALQPHIEELQKKYKDNPERRNKEMMELYRVHKVNPMGGCLPLALQLPVFFALYQALIRSIALKGASFLWIKDLSEPDRLWMLPFALPLLGNEVNILPIFMALAMFWQQKISPTSSSTGSAEQQKLMLILFPLMFGFIFYRMPAALVLYWSMNSALTLIYQLRVTRLK